eukprot:maker-scaffold_3-snap-gene-10.52-mRNA-1 protein AED:0.02 eAED:0.02 QI:57/1/1/1/1/1/3/75/207
MSNSEKDSWCDTEFGWGPIVQNDIYSLTLCACSTFLEIPVAILFLFVVLPRAIKQTQHHPLINPTHSTTYTLKTLLSIFSFLIILALLLCEKKEFQSISNKLGLLLTALCWLSSLLLLHVSNGRRLKQHYIGLRGFWISEFLIQVVIFCEYSVLRGGETIHILRGFYMIFCVCLFVLSFSPIDQEKYENVDFSQLDDFVDENTPLIP